MTLNGTDLIGKDVITSDGRNVGTVTDVTIDPAKWMVRDLRVAIDRRLAEELGLPKQRIGASQFALRTSMVKSVGDLIMLNPTLKMLAEQATSARKKGDVEPFD
jgi:sporulation protein YlmC with PRC-barrel domain